MPVMPMPPQAKGLPEGEQPTWLRQLLVQLGASRPRTQREVGHQIAGSVQNVPAAVVGKGTQAARAAAMAAAKVAKPLGEGVEAMAQLVKLPEGKELVVKTPFFEQSLGRVPWDQLVGYADQIRRMVPTQMVGTGRTAKIVQEYVKPLRRAIPEGRKLNIRGAAARRILKQGEKEGITFSADLPFNIEIGKVGGRVGAYLVDLGSILPILAKPIKVK